MPGYDGTGPSGRGPGTGRRLGICGIARPGSFGYRYAGYGRGPGWGMGRGYGRGFCHWWPGAPGPYYNGPDYPREENEKEFLKEQVDILKTELAEMEKRMAELEE